MKKIVLVVFALMIGMSINAQDKKKSEKMKPTMKLNGRVQWDYASIQYEEDDMTDEEKSAAHLNGNEFRRVYFSAKGKLGSKIGYKAEFEFAGGEIAYRDVYISYKTGKHSKLAFGSMAEATGLNMSTSSKYITFMSRAMLTSFQNFRWGSGIHYANFNVFDSGVTFQTSLTNNGSHKAGFKDTELEEGMNFVARATYAFILDDAKHNLVHLGVNYDSRQAATVEFRPENHMGAVEYALGFDSDKRTDLGMEVATTFGPLSVQGEYKMNSNDVGDKTYNVNTYYAFASYFLTGEHRPYKKGTFGRVKPINTIDNGGMGAFELAVRYSAVDNSDFVEGGNYDGLSNITAGINWYLNAHARVMYNLVLTDFNGKYGEKQTAHMVRVAVDF